jgi:hypothetical protein
LMPAATLEEELNNTYSASRTTLSDCAMLEKAASSFSESDAS